MAKILLDRERSLEFTFPVIRDIQRRMGMPFGEVLAHLSTKMDLEALVVVLWFGLKADDRTLRFEKVEDLIETYRRQGGNWLDLIRVIDVATEECGFFRTPRDEASDRGSPSRSSP